MSQEEQLLRILQDDQRARGIIDRMRALAMELEELALPPDPAVTVALFGRWHLQRISTPLPRHTTDDLITYLREHLTQVG